LGGGKKKKRDCGSQKGQKWSVARKRGRGEGVRGGRKGGSSMQCCVDGHYVVRTILGGRVPESGKGVKKCRQKTYIDGSGVVQTRNSRSAKLNKPE